ncbi:helix-turn-helix transcriptional regulator [Candidatus Gottesmanbacteria bacterium]|nr:helix-turn-helix transcriptional regulator [Candidatus Gottesmanbacteria bacterium]
MEEQLKNTPNCLRKYRRARNLTQRDVAKILNIKNASMISRWEKGVCLPGTINLLRLAILYRTLAEALLIDHVRIIKPEIYKREEKYAR